MSSPTTDDDLEAQVMGAFYRHRLRMKLGALDIPSMRALARSNPAMFATLYPPARVATAATPALPVATMTAPATQEKVPSPTTAPTEPVPDPKPAPAVPKAPPGVQLPAPPTAEEPPRLYSLGQVGQALFARAKASGRPITLADATSEAAVLLKHYRGRGVVVPPPEAPPAPPEAGSPLRSLADVLSRRHGISTERATQIARDIVAKVRAGRR